MAALLALSPKERKKKEKGEEGEKKKGRFRTSPVL